jgi:glucosamine 6-phosphate synthetase-like amidotransferase/phosphosugar isomerase protein
VITGQAFSSPTSSIGLFQVTQRVLTGPDHGEKSGYKHFMLRKSSSSRRPRAKRFLAASRRIGRVFLDEMKITEKQLASIDKVTILACGTSWHAGIVGKFAIDSSPALQSTSTTAPNIDTAARSSARTHWPSSSRSRVKRRTRSPRFEAKRGGA